MKRSLILLLMSFIISLTACQSDFDEVEDTQQRHIIFSFDTGELFSNVLSRTGDTFALSGIKEIPSGYRLRISTYGYDASDSLIYTKTILSETLTGQSLKVRHLMKSIEYRFVFVADIVKYDPYVDYYETWFQLGTKSWPDFYIYSEQRHDEAELNCMASAVMILAPGNQDVEVHFKPDTYNGYCIFDNLDGIDRLSGYVMNTSKFNMRTGSWQQRTSDFYSFDERNPNGSGIVKPVSLCNADSVITIKFRTLTLHGTDSTYINIPNQGRRPFAAKINSRDLSLEECVFY